MIEVCTLPDLKGETWGARIFYSSDVGHRPK